MQLISARVTNFKCVIDSGDVEFEQAVTCLVGQNEAGKSAFLRALSYIMPVDGSPPAFEIDADWPKAIPMPADGDLGEHAVVAATFHLDEGDRAVVVDAFGCDVLAGNILTLRRMYDGALEWDADFDRDALFASAQASVREAGIEFPTIRDATSLEALMAGLGDETEPEVMAARDALSDSPALGADEALARVLDHRVPRFLYFDQYSELEPAFNMTEIWSRANEGRLEASDRTVLALLRLGGVDGDSLVQTESQERRRHGLESASGEVTRYLASNWSQNPDIRVEFDALDTVPGSALEAQRQPGGIAVRVFDSSAPGARSVSLKERSSGFNWFFSFCAQYLAINTGSEGHHRLVLLLDEPGLHLHASAQNDLLHLLSSQLASHHQVVFTTHSPFMINPDAFDTVRTVVRDNAGTTVSADALLVGDKAALPLQAALGYSLSQTLFVGANILLVEGPADLRFIQVMRHLLDAGGRTSLDPRWIVVPVGGKDKMPSFVALFGRQLNCAALADGTIDDHKRLGDCIERNVVDRSHIFLMGDYVDRSHASIEDMFGDRVYLGFAHKALGLSSRAVPKGSDSIVRRLSRSSGAGRPRFNHDAPARELERTPDKYLAKMSEEDLSRWERLFGNLNRLIT